MFYTKEGTRNFLKNGLIYRDQVVFVCFIGPFCPDSVFQFCNHPSISFRWLKGILQLVYTFINLGLLYAEDKNS